MPKLRVCFEILSQTHGFLYPPYPVAPSCFWTLCPFLLTRWRACCLTLTDSATGPDGISPCVLKTCSAALAHPLSVLVILSFAKGHLPSSWTLRIFHRAKSILGTPELLTTYKAFICSLREYCSPLWAGAPASHLARLHAVKTKAFRIMSGPVGSLDQILIGLHSLVPYPPVVLIEH